MRLENVYIAATCQTTMVETSFRETIPEDMALHVLYELLEEREPHQNISHKELPSWEEHEKFVASDPYKAWFLILVDKQNTLGVVHEVVGATYLTHANEIGIQIFKSHQGEGFGKQAVQMLMDAFEGPFLANINPNNDISVSMFEGLGFKHVQNTYKLEVSDEKMDVDSTPVVDVSLH